MLLQAVLSRQPVLDDIVQTYGAKTLSEYAESWRIEPLIDASALQYIAELCKELYGEQIAIQAAEQIKRCPLVSTVDHHGILNHPFFLNSNLVFSLKAGQKYLVCLPTEGVSLNNSSWPGSLVYHGRAGMLRRVSFFPASFKHKIILAAPALSKAGVEKSLSRRNEYPETTEGIAELLNDEKIYSFKNFSLQASYLSCKLWSWYFPDAPQVLYLPLETLTSRILAESFQNKNSLLSRLLASEEGWLLLEKYFQGLRGAFGFGDSGKGSFLYWAVNGKGEREQLRRRGSELLSLAGISVLSNPEQLSQSLQYKTMYPSSLVCFLVLLLGGVTCLGGFNQTTWLAGIQKQFVALLKEMGEIAAAEKVGQLATDNFAETDLAFLRDNHNITKATGIDILLRKDKGLYGKYQKLAHALSLSDSIKLSLPEIYKVVVPERERQPSLLAITTSDIAHELGLAKKLSLAGI